MELDLLILYFGLSMAMCYLAIFCRALTLGENRSLYEPDIIPSEHRKGNNDGYECELQFNSELRLYIDKDDYLIPNLVFKKKKQVICEIDSVLVSRKGLFCIEIKNARGTGRGGDTVLHWKFKKNVNAKGHSIVENPVKQNERHCEILEESLDYHYLSKNIIVFPYAKDIRKIRSKNVFTTETFLKYYKSLRRNKLKRKDVLEIVHKLGVENPTTKHPQRLKRLTREQMIAFQLS